MRYIVFLLMITITGYSQTIDRNNIIARQKLQYSGGNPDSNKIAVSVDANGIFKWVYFTDFQDSVNTGIYDTGSFNAIRISAPFTDEIMSLGSDSVVTGCGFGCDDIRWKTVNGTQTVLKDSTDNVGIGTSIPIVPLHVVGASYVIHEQGNFRARLLVLSDSTVNSTIQLISDNTNTGETTQLDIVPNGLNVLYDDGTGTVTQSLQIGNDGILFNQQPTDGNVGIGTGTPTEKLHVAGTSLFTDSLTYQDGTQADGYVLTSDATGTATWQDPTAYGEMGFGDSLRTIAINENVFSVVTNSNNTLWSTAAVDLHNVTYSGDSLIIDSAGTYQVNIQLSMDGTNGSVIRLGVFLNGVLACSCTGYQELSSNRIIQLTYINIDQLNANDVLQVVVTNTANNDDVDVIGGKLMVNKIR